VVCFGLIAVELVGRLVFSIRVFPERVVLQYIAALRGWEAAVPAFASGFGDALATVAAVGEFKLFQDRLRSAIVWPASP